MCNIGSIIRCSSITDFEFIDEAFDNINKNAQTQLTNNSVLKSGIAIPDRIKKIIDAYNEFEGTNNWQRDYIYYNLTNSQTRGTLNKNIMEHLVGFELNSGNLNFVDQDDPTSLVYNGESVYSGSRGSTVKLWTDGNFEFKVKITLNHISGLGSSLVKYFSVKPEDLFTAQTITTGSGRRSSTVFTGTFTPKKVNLDIPLFAWDLEKISVAVKIGIEEVDCNQTVKSTASTTSEFASNFEFNASTGETQKVGLKFWN